ncbi:MAG: hypothetical protein MJY66_02580 [Bacteroidaceae bacterium]|nr:hypothetical protein [Bacteroidaceae bacterium]
MKKNILHYSCQRAVDAVPKQFQKELRQSLSEIFGNPCRTTYYQHLRDYRNIPFEVKTRVEDLFTSRYHIPKDRIWTIWGE